MLELINFTGLIDTRQSFSTTPPSQRSLALRLHKSGFSSRHIRLSHSGRTSEDWGVITARVCPSNEIHTTTLPLPPFPRVCTRLLCLCLLLIHLTTLLSVISDLLEDAEPYACPSKIPGDSSRFPPPPFPWLCAVPHTRHICSSVVLWNKLLICLRFVTTPATACSPAPSAGSSSARARWDSATGRGRQFEGVVQQARSVHDGEHLTS